MRVLELFSGIGGVAAAVAGRAEVVAAIDHDEHAALTYRHAWPGHPQHRWNLASVKPERLAALGADLWWASPPCQPFTVRGRARDLDDPRCQPLLRVLDALAVARPAAFALENVPGFAGSRAHAAVRSAARGLGYHLHEAEWCPSTLGLANRRRRFYLLATRDPVPAPVPRPVAARRLPEVLDPDPDPALDADPELLRRYAGNLALVDADDREAVTHCFTGAYGRSPVYCGSWLRQGERIRRFSPAEILRLLGFPEGFALPPGLPADKRYKLVGNSVSVPVVRAWLGPLLDDHVDEVEQQPVEG